MILAFNFFYPFNSKQITPKGANYSQNSSPHSPKSMTLRLTLKIVFQTRISIASKIEKGKTFAIFDL